MGSLNRTRWMGLASRQQENRRLGREDHAEQFKNRSLRGRYAHTR